MDAKQPAATDLEREVEAWEWARAAGVSADELRQALASERAALELREAA